MGRAIFITGTGTDLGKSALSLAALLWARSRGLEAAYCKPVQCGAFPFGDPPTPHGDAEWIRGLMPTPITTHVIYKFQAPVSPHLAAEREKSAIDPERIRQELEALVHAHEFVVMEGAGGAAVPLDRKGTSLIAIASEIEIPCLLACAPGLGTLHHSLSTLAYLDRLAAEVLGFAFCHREPETPEMFADNLRTLRELTGLPCFGALPHLPDLRAATPLSTGAAEALAAPLSPALDAWWKTQAA